MNAGRVLTDAALALLLAAPPSLAASGSPHASEKVQALGDEYVAHRLAGAPHLATRLGVHTDDDRLLPATGADELAWLRAFQARLAEVPRDALTRERAALRDLLEAASERDRLELEVLRPRERDPGAYAPIVADAIESVLERGGVSACARVHMATARLAWVPEVLRSARLELRNPPRLLTEAAIERFEGVLAFYRRSLPGLASGCRTATLQADLAQADTAAVRAVESFLAYLREDLLPASHGSLAIGPEPCRRWLRSAMLVEPAPIETLLAWSEREVDTRRAELDTLAARVAAGGARAARDALAAPDPGYAGRTADLSSGRRRVTAFLKQRDLVTLPSRIDLEVRVAPPSRPLPDGLALNAAGPWEPPATAAWLEAAPIATGGARDSAAAAPGNRWEADLAVAHQGVPGRYLRALALRGGPSRLHSALLDAWPGEDWGADCEAMLIEEGYGADDPRYRFAAALRALRRAGRSYAALSFHAGARSLEEVGAMLEERCLLAPAEARRDARWAASDPSLMGYTLSARGLLDLREEARRTLGPRFRIREFNDAVLRSGASPLGLVRDEVRRQLGMVADDSPLGAK